MLFLCQSQYQSHSTFSSYYITKSKKYTRTKLYTVFYKNTAREIEARDVASRIDYTDEPKDGNIAPFFASNNRKVATSLSVTYSRVIDEAVTKAQLGMTDYQSAMRQTLKALADSGIKTVDYATGYSRRLDTAVRQNVLWGIKQCNQNTADIVGEQFGADGYEISYHSNPRPSHEEMGGKQYAIGKGQKINDVYYPPYSDVSGLLEDYNCLHFSFSILLGVSEPAYGSKELAALKAKDAETFEFEGKKYTKYEASQVQRELETRMRRQKDRAQIAKAAGDDDMRRAAQAKINVLVSKYKQFSDASGLPTKMERASAAGHRRVKTKAELKPKILTKTRKNNTIYSSKTFGNTLSNQPLRIPQVPSSTITKKIELGEYGTKLSVQQYNKHIEGTSAYTTYKADRLKKGGNPQSILSISRNEAQELILNKSGTGIVRCTKLGVLKPQESFSCDRVIGYYYGNGKYWATNKATIHYSKKGAHLVPIRGDDFD